MDKYTNTVFSASRENRSTSDSETRLNHQGCGVVWVGNSKGIAPAMGYLAQAFANGDDIFGYRLATKRFETVLLTSIVRAGQIYNKLLTLKKKDHFKLLTADDLLTLHDENLSSKQFVRRLEHQLREAEIVIVDFAGFGETDTQRPRGFAPIAYERELMEFFIASVSQRASTIFVGQVGLSGGFKPLCPTSMLDHELYLYRFGGKNESMSFLVNWTRSGGVDIDVDALQVCWREKASSGEYRWQIEPGVLDSDPIMELAFHLRRQGMSYQRIGNLLGCGRSTVHRWVTADRSATSSESR